MNTVKKTTYVSLFLCICLGVGMLGILLSSEDVPTPVAGPVDGDQDSAQLGDAAPMDDENSFEPLERIFSGQDVFKPMVGLGDASRAGVSPNDDNTDNHFLMDQYRVVGIVLDQDPRTVIEDKTTKEVFFLSTGSVFAGARVEKILPGKVILDVNGQTVELKP